MISFIKRVIAERIVIKILAFLFALGIIPILIFMYGLDDEPDWIMKKNYNFKHSYTMTIDAPLELFNIKKSKTILKENAKIKFSKEIYNRAIKQIKVSYDWKYLDEDTKKIIVNELNNLFLSQNFYAIKEQAIYEDKLKFTIYGLYSIESAKIDTILQEVYAQINKKMMSLYQ